MDPLQRRNMFFIYNYLGVNQLTCTVYAAIHSTKIVIVRGKQARWEWKGRQHNKDNGYHVEWPHRRVPFKYTLHQLFVTISGHNQKKSQ